VVLVFLVWETMVETMPMLATRLAQVAAVAQTLLVRLELPVLGVMVVLVFLLLWITAQLLVLAVAVVVLGVQILLALVVLAVAVTQQTTIQLLRLEPQIRAAAAVVVASQRVTVVRVAQAVQVSSSLG